MCVWESMYECIKSFFQTNKTTTKQIVRAHNKWCTNHNVCAVVFPCPCFVVQWVKACSALELCLGQRLRTYRSSFYQLKPLSRKRQERKSIKQSPLSHHMLTSSIHNRLMARFGNRSTLTGTHLGAAGGKRKCGQCILEPKWRRILRG